MPFVQRDEDGKVTGRFAIQQPGIAEEWLADSHPDLQPTVADLIQANRAAVQGKMDRQAQQLGYDTIFTAITYAGGEDLTDPMQAKFQAEGNAFKAWRSAVWAHAYSVLDDVQVGAAEMPTPEEAVAMMPALVLP